MKNKSVKIFLIILLLILLSFTYSKIFKKDKITELPRAPLEETISNSNIIEKVKYVSKDESGREYIITASQGEIDYSNTDIIFLTDVKGYINLNNSDYVKISSDYGKYNITNFDTIFSKNVIIEYPDNKIIAEYLEFSIQRNLMLISRDVIYTNLDNTLNADVIEINLETKDIKIFMNDNKNIKIKSKN